MVESIKERIRPTKEELEAAWNFYHEIKELIESSLNLRCEFKVELEGSLAKGTCLRSEIDLDVFILVRNDAINNEWIKKEIIDPLIPPLSARYTVQLRYATHPYIRVVRSDGIEADIVPAYWARSIKEIRTSVDRTPFHTRYVISNLSDEQKDEVRLLKKFFKGIGVYGAEIKVEGFSGYLCELLIIKYGSFISTLKSMSKWRIPHVVAISNLSKHDVRMLLRLFKDSALIFPDPVDPRRNAAAALSKQSVSTAILASMCFLTNPSDVFFFPRRELVSIEKLSKQIINSKRCTAFIVLKINEEVVPDVLWGILKKFLRKGENIISQFGFKVIDSRIWSDEKELAVVFYETEFCRLSEYELHEGPPPYVGTNLSRFINKYLVNRSGFGPWIGRDGRPHVLRKRKYVEITDVLHREVIGKLPKELSVVDVVVNSLTKLPVKLLSNKEFVYWLTEAVLKAPSWMEIGCRSDSSGSALC